MSNGDKIPLAQPNGNKPFVALRNSLMVTIFQMQKDFLESLFRLMVSVNDMVEMS
jgi:hypothetical protein